MSNLILLGTGCPSPSSLRYGPSTLLIHNEKNYLFDCGSGVTQRLSEVGIKSSEIDVVFITHLHSDHIMDLYQLYISGWHQGRNTKFRVIGPKGIKSFFNNILKAFEQELKGRVQWEKRPNIEGLNFDITEIDSSFLFSTDGLVVKPFEVDHYPVVPAYGYQIKHLDDSVEKILVVSGDTRKSESLIQNAMEANVLLHEVFVDLQFDQNRMSKETIKNVSDYHTSPKEIGEIAKTANVKKLVLTHFVPPVFDKAKLLKDISQSYEGEIIIGEDLMSIKI